MDSIAYWDVDSLRMRKVIRELESPFNLRLAATFGELQQIIAGMNLVAVLIGLPLIDQEGTLKMVDSLVHESECPVFVLVDGQRPS